MYSIFAIIITVAYAKLGILTPNELATQFVTQNNSIAYSVANFGHIPWGRQLIGQVVLAIPFDACSPVTFSANLETEKPFVLVQRGGGCTFVAKVRNCQASGAALVIIMDDSIEQTEKIVMSDDGFGYSVTAPSIFIGEKNGEMIQNYITDTSSQTARPLNDMMRHEKHAILVMKFDVIKAENTLVIFDLTFQNRESFKLVREFHKYYKQLKNDKVEFQIFYDQFTCPSCYAHSFSQAEDDCLGGGLYCVIDPDGEKIASGRQVIEEQLRQLCLFRVDPNHWWKYVSAFDKECILPQAYEQCSRQLMKSEDIDVTSVDQCVIASFNVSSNTNRLIQTNYILDEQKRFKDLSGLMFYPGAVINNQSYRGAIDAKDIFGEICNSMIEHPDYCKQYLDDEFNKTILVVGGSHLATIIFCVTMVLIVFFLFMVFIYRRMVRKEMSKEMSQQVNQMVSQYISFYEAKDKSQIN